MAIIRSLKNQYLGINAHLHSFWQAAGHWNRFHRVHVAHLMADLKAQLIPLGYTAHLDYSLQVEKSDTGLNAIAIHEYPSDSGVIAWIELLSPQIKGTTSEAKTYQEKRLSLARQQIVFVELDYLHETPPTFLPLPDYTRGERNAYPYQIIIMDSRPDFDSGTTAIYPFAVDDPICSVGIPLNSRDVLAFDFGAAYQRTFEHARFGDNVDYSQFPMNFERYSVADQTRIARRMLAVLKAHHEGVNLENAPFPIEDAPLDDALKEIAALTASP